MSKQGIIFNIQRFSVNDGPGIRTTVFLKGCPLSCNWCHNPEGISNKIQTHNGETFGKKITAEDLFTEINKDRVFYDQSGGGATFSGGEPLAQPDFLYENIERCKENGIHTAIDTTGYADLGLIKKISKKADLFLYDLKFIDPRLHIKHTGVSNSEILENLNFLLNKGYKVIIRIPLIPDITFTGQNLNEIIRFLDKYETKPEINLLPYHRIAQGKYDKFNIKYKIQGRELSKENIEQTETLFNASGYKVKVGG
jgi:pyruvate formate lyase activating enzyme